MRSHTHHSSGNFVDIYSLIRLRAIGNKADLREETSVKRHELQPGDSLPFCKAISPHFRAPIVAEDLVAPAYLQGIILFCFAVHSSYCRYIVLILSCS